MTGQVDGHEVVAAGDDRQAVQHFHAAGAIDQGDGRDEDGRQRVRDVHDMQAGEPARDGREPAGDIHVDVGIHSLQVEIAEQHRRGGLGDVDDGEPSRARGHVGLQRRRIRDGTLDVDLVGRAGETRGGDHTGRGPQPAQGVGLEDDLGEVGQAVAVGVGQVLPRADREFDVVGQAVAVAVVRGAGREYEIVAEADGAARTGRGATTVGDQASGRIEYGHMIRLGGREEEAEVARRVTSRAEHHRTRQLGRLDRHEVVTPVRVNRLG